MKNRIWVLVGLLIQFMGCMGPLENVQNPGNGAGTVVLNEEFVDQGTGWVKYSTNDPLMLGSKGRSILRVSQSDFSGATGFEANIKKSSGQILGGYGLIWNYQGPGKFWFCQIDNTGYYHVGKVVGGEIISLNTPKWKISSALMASVGVTNKVKIQNGTGGFELYFNGQLIETFTDSGFGEVLANGKVGFEVDLEPTEQFPDVPVTVEFQVLTPGVTW